MRLCHILKNFFWSQFRALVYDHDPMLVCEVQKLLRWRPLTCAYRIGAKPVDQIEIFDQRSVIETSTSNLP